MGCGAGCGVGEVTGLDVGLGLGDRTARATVTGVRISDCTTTHNCDSDPKGWFDPDHDHDHGLATVRIFSWYPLGVQGGYQRAASESTHEAAHHSACQRRAACRQKLGLCGTLAYAAVLKPSAATRSRAAVDGMR